MMSDIKGQITKCEHCHVAKTSDGVFHATFLSVSENERCVGGVRKSIGDPSLVLAV
jgi:hypothetical protein